MAKTKMRSVVLPAGWYRFEVVSYRSELARAGDSTNYIFELVCRSDTKKFDGVHISHYFNSKVKGYMLPFFEACGVIDDYEDYVYPFPRLFPRLRFGLNAPVDKPNKSVGATIEAFVRPGEYRGYPTNELTLFRSSDGID